MNQKTAKKLRRLSRAINKGASEEIIRAHYETIREAYKKVPKTHKNIVKGAMEEAVKSKIQT